MYSYQIYSIWGLISTVISQKIFQKNFLEIFFEKILIPLKKFTIFPKNFFCSLRKLLYEDTVLKKKFPNKHIFVKLKYYDCFLCDCEI